MERLTIGDLARATRTRVETIRDHERFWLLPAPARTAGNHPAYAAEHLGRPSVSRRARDLGFPLAQVGDLLALADQRQRSCAAVDAIARQDLAEVERKIADLAAPRRELTDIIGQCRQEGHGRRVPDHRGAGAGMTLSPPSTPLLDGREALHAWPKRRGRVAMAHALPSPGGGGWRSATA
jgi:DNA-binding transcriptional MerR regulator